MKILFLTNNNNSESILSFLKKIKKLSVLQFNQKLTVEFVTQFNPELIISYGYRFIIKNDIINLFRDRIINLHISLLPWNRGADPNIWSYLDDTPKGVTIHYIDEGIDTGDIILQKEVNIDEKIHTLASSYDLLHQEIQYLFIHNWNQIKENKIRLGKQKGNGSIHYLKDLVHLRKIFDERGWNITIEEIKNYANVRNENK